ncbi:hypothetical protein EC991_008130, partial [Linnemannia zychae]
MVHPYFDPAQTTTFNDLALKTDSTFELRYFHVHGMGAMSRTIIAIGRGQLINVHLEDWEVVKPKAPFGVIPLLTETSADGKTRLQIAESNSIERYFARKFGLFGNGTVFEEVLVESFASNTQALNSQIFEKYSGVRDPAVKAAKKGPLIDNHIFTLDQVPRGTPPSQHKATLADAKTDYVITIIQPMTGEELISESKTPAIWKVRQEMDKIESVAAWKASEEYKSISKDNYLLLGY